MNKAGIIGLGIVGSRVAKNLRQAGVHTYVWSRSPKPEPNFLGSAADVAQLAPFVQIFVRKKRFVEKPPSISCHSVCL